MADTMTCPLCDQQHPAATTYCTTLWTPIPSAVGPSTSDSSADDVVTDDSPGLVTTPKSTSLVTCATCGDQGHPGQRCRQCFDPLPAAQPAAIDSAVVVLPSGTRIRIPCGQEVLIGRHSDVPLIRQGLESFDAVGRRHCYVTVSGAGEVSVRDPGSTNGTWVGDDSRQVLPDETRTVRLPARVRLGQHLSITFAAEGSQP